MNYSKLSYLELSKFIIPHSSVGQKSTWTQLGPPLRDLQGAIWQGLHPEAL